MIIVGKLFNTKKELIVYYTIKHSYKKFGIKNKLDVNLHYCKKHKFSYISFLGCMKVQYIKEILNELDYIEKDFKSFVLKYKNLNEDLFLGFQIK